MLKSRLPFPIPKQRTLPGWYVSLQDVLLETSKLPSDGIHQCRTPSKIVVNLRLPPPAPSVGGSPNEPQDWFCRFRNWPSCYHFFMSAQSSYKRTDVSLRQGEPELAVFYGFRRALTSLQSFLFPSYFFFVFPCERVEWWAANDWICYFWRWRLIQTLRVLTSLASQ